MSSTVSFRWRLQVYKLVLVVPPLLHLTPLHRLAPWLGAVRPALDPPPITSLAAMVDHWLRRLPWPWRYTCLKRATILYGLLRRAGMDIELRIGVRREPDRSLAAHAWLVRDGQPFLEPLPSAFESFRVIATFPEPGSTPS